ncbi:BACON domain-containing protein [Porphyromonas sp.]|uniref:BACON domain-containing protein n=1 Tax=Porphyromonas sp. TaxID=1924944 RepID=UPI0026DBC87D|nr:BACON domain-containing protein [Porphyromonas sp.]MDO4695763.1 BACON domain-containing protein [Porphyromonas sp.]MDO4770470.1 BACON domain-containing protein [Porphyromonas sp.]
MKLSTKLFALATLLIGLSIVSTSCSKDNPEPPVTPKLDITDKTISIAAEGEEKSAVFETNVDWTASVPTDAKWLSITPTSGTSGKITLKVTAMKNEGAERTAEITIMAGTKSDKITVTQAAKAVAEKELLFLGSDFEDEAAFKGALNNYGLTNATIADGGKNGKGLKVQLENLEKNSYMFTATFPKGKSLEGKKSIEFYIKGNSAKSFSIQVFRKDGKYDAFNVGTITNDKTEVIIKPTTKANNTTGSAQNDYKGTIDTGNKWVKVTLDLTPILSNVGTTEGKDFFTFKLGNKSKYDIMIDEITLQ